MVKKRERRRQEIKDSMKYDREESEQLEGPKDSTEMKVVIEGAE